MSIVKSVAWLLAFLLGRIFLGKQLERGAGRDEKNAIFLAMCLGGTSFCIKLMFGLFLGQVGKSPYLHSIPGMIQNLFMVLPAIFAREYYRSFLLNGTIGKRISKRYRSLWKGGLVLFFSFFEWSPLVVFSIANSNAQVEEAARYFIESGLPALLDSTVALYLTAYGGYLGSAAFFASEEVMHWLFPILPELSKLFSGLLHMIVCAVAIFVVQMTLEKRRVKYGIERRKGRQSEAGMGVLLIVLVAFLWFVEGVFPIYPSVVMTGSMEPEISPGDVLLIQKVNKDGIKNIHEGDILFFEKDGVKVSHRVIKVEEVDGTLLGFYTKGDNNKSEDAGVVAPTQVRGKVLSSIAYGGYPVYLLKGRGQDIPDGIND